MAGTPKMARPFQILSPSFVFFLIVLIGSAVSLALLHDTVLGCTVGFNASNQPLDAGAAAVCPGYDIGSAILVPICLIAGAVLIWLGVRFLRADPNKDPPEKAGSDPPRRADSRSALRRAVSRLLAMPTYRWVCVLIAIFFVASFFAASWEYINFLAGTWDLSINQQALSSTILGGKPYVFYEAFNCGRHGQCSFLQVHPVFFGFPVSAVYGIAPTAYTLFAIQSAAVGLGALPLYAIAVDVTGSRRLSLIVTAAFLAWAPLFLAIFSFHWEAFIPVEMFTLFWLWSRHRYLLAIPVVLLSFVTLEVTPVMVFFVGLYFLWPWLVKAVRLLYHAVAGALTARRNAPSKLRLWVRWTWKSLHVPEVDASIALMVGSLAAYVLLRLFVTQGGWLFGLSPVPPAYALPLSSPNRVFTFSIAALSYAWQSKLGFWIVIYLTLGLVPLFAPRTLLLVLPWFILTGFNTSAAFWRFGDQYPFIPAAALFIGFTFGLNRLHLWTSARLARATAARSIPKRLPTDSLEDGRINHAPRRARWTLDRATGSGAFSAAQIVSFGVVILILGNLFLNPLNPLSASIIPGLGRPFVSTHDVTIGPLPDNGPLQQLVSIIPPNAIVTAPLPVYTWVADDPYAYPMVSGINVARLPGASGLPDYVLLPYVTPNSVWNSTLLGVIYDSSEFGVRGCVSNSAAGGVELFERNYTGAPETFGPIGVLCPNYFSGGSGLIPGPFASISANASSPSGTVVRSTPCAANGTLWTGPNITLPPGVYRLKLVLNAFNSTASSCQQPQVKPISPLLSFNITGQYAGGVLPTVILHHNFRVNALCTPLCGGWRYWNTTITLGPTTSDLSISGSVRIGQYIVQISYLLVSPVLP
jgi:uncharacterized membrane protein